MRKVSVSLKGHRTSFSLEEEFYTLLKALAQDRGMSLAKLVGAVDDAREGNLSSALRLEVLCALANAPGPALSAAFTALPASKLAAETA